MNYDQVPEPEFSVGMPVYRNYTPVKCGKVVEVIGPLREAEGRPWYYKYRVRWIKGTEETVMWNGLQSFQHLVDEHERKFIKHSETLRKLKAL
jgi:hypothetical protein